MELSSRSDFVPIWSSDNGSGLSSPRVYKSAMSSAEPSDYPPQTSSSKPPSIPAKAMKVFIILSIFIVAISAQRAAEYRNEENYPPIPYSFNYNADLEDGGRSSHEETSDGSGRVTGSYTVQGEDGYGRVVDYIADENGFRATIRTNEPGTASVNPADVVMESTFDDQALRTTPVVNRPAVVPTNGGRTGIRYVLVPITDPRARAAGYYY